MFKKNPIKILKKTKTKLVDSVFTGVLPTKQTIIDPVQPTNQQQQKCEN